jgi:predicted RNA binding protein YcfA (HicA-like mRNA interferase family)
MRARELIRYAEAKGWRFVRRGGRSSHAIYEHDEYSYQVVIPIHGGKDFTKRMLEQLLKQIEGRWKGPIR